MTASAAARRSTELVPLKISSMRKRTGGAEGAACAVGRGGFENGVEAFDLGEELGFAFGERVGEGERRAECDGRNAGGGGADGRTGEREYGAGPDGAKQGGFAGHIGSADEIEASAGVEGDVVGDAAGEKRMAKSGGFEGGGRGVGEDFGVKIFGDAQTRRRRGR